VRKKGFFCVLLVGFTTGTDNIRMIESLYQSSMNSFTPQERVQRSIAMCKWSREIMARQLHTKLGDISPQRLRLEVARRVYASDVMVAAWIDRELADVSC